MNQVASVELDDSPTSSETDMLKPRLRRSNCIKKSKNPEKLWRSSFASSRSQPCGGVAGSHSEDMRKRETRHRMLDIGHSRRDGFDSSFESLSACDDSGVGVEPESVEESRGRSHGPLVLMPALWSHLPEVRNSTIFGTLTKMQKYRQEAKYEILSSEVAYNQKLHVLEDVFMNGVLFADDNSQSKAARENVFKNMRVVTECSDRFLEDIYASWRSCILLPDIFDVVHEHATHNFTPYVRYCTKKTDMEVVLKRLQNEFNLIKDNPALSRQTLDSCFLSPMQRITRLPLLVSNCITRMAKSDEDYEICEKAYNALLQVADDCNEHVRHKERMENTIVLVRRIEFPRSITSIGLISRSRWLVRHEEFTLHLSSRKSLPTKSLITLILFNDLLLISWRKNDQYVVDSYCKTNLAKMSKTDDVSNIAEKYKTDKERRYWIMLTFLSNHAKQQQAMVLSCENAAKRGEWIAAFEPPTSDILGEIVYHAWDCPVVLAVQDYSSSRPGHLSFTACDKIHVLKKTINGLYEGKRDSDGRRGLFPKECVTEIDSEHKQAGDLRRKLNRMNIAS